MYRIILYRKQWAAAFCTFIVLLYSFTLVLPYFSTYFEKEGVRIKRQESPYTEKLQLSAALYASPAETTVGKLLPVVHVRDAAVNRIIQSAFLSQLYFTRLKDHNGRPAAYSDLPDPWQPSLVIALRKLII